MGSRSACWVGPEPDVGLHAVQRRASHAFVHALNTRTRTARCIDLPWAGEAQNILENVQLGLVRSGVLTLTDPGGGMLAVAASTRAPSRSRRSSGSVAGGGRDHARRLRRECDLLDDFVDVAVGVEDAQLALGAVAAGQDGGDPFQLALGAELAGVRLDLA